MVKEFWQEIGFLVNVEMPEAGVMETDWAENRARVPDGFVRNTLGKVLDSVYSTSRARQVPHAPRARHAAGHDRDLHQPSRHGRGVHLARRSDQTKWQPRPPNPELEAEMLRRLMVRLGVQEERAKAQVADGAPRRRARRCSKRDDGAALTLNEQFDRAWRRVGLALDRVGFTVEDRDRSKGMYFVRYIDPEHRQRSGGRTRGWFSRFKFWGKQRPEESRAVPRRRERPGRARRSERAQQGRRGASTSPTASRILTLLHEQLQVS